MSELLGIYAIWYREFKVFWREKSRVITSIINPLMWLVIFGGGLGASVSVGQVGYQQFIFPGILTMAIVMSSIFFGAYVVWDKKIDFLKEVLVAPLSRTTIFMGKILGGATDSLMQATILVLIGTLFGITYTVQSLLVTYLFLFLLTIAVVSIGLIIGSVMESPEGFGLITSFFVFPLTFLSGAFYPLNNLPQWLAIATKIDPVTYAVDGLRGAILGTSYNSLLFDFSLLSVFCVAMIVVGTIAFNRMKL
jgi:ABC-2 type transport system permease protein